MIDLDSKTITAITSAIMTLIMFFLKSLWDKHFHDFKLKTDHQYEQRKKIKEAISKYKVRLLDSGESLNHRLWNFSDNIGNGWHQKKRDTPLNEHYYLMSFSYRFLSFFAWCRKIENEMLFLDSTISESDDLEFIKYLKTLPQLFSDTSLFKGQDYNSSHDNDHFFKDDFFNMIDTLITDDGVISFSTFKGKSNDLEYQKIINHFSDIAKDKSCLKWHTLNIFHFMLMAFLSKFGYDFQKTSRNKLFLLSNRNPKNILTENIIEILNRNQLERTKEIKLVMDALHGNLTRKGFVAI